MARKAKPQTRVLLYPDSVRPPPTLPDAESVIKMGLKLSEQETTVVRMAMAIHSASRQPKLTWSGWRHLAVALSIGSDHAKKASGGAMDSPLYRRVMTEFLRNTGFAFINKDDRAAAVRLLAHWDEIDAWRSSLSHSRQQALNNPREVHAAWLEHRRELGDPEAKHRPSGSRHRQFPSLLEQYEALTEQLVMAEERAERAERESEFFETMAQEIAKTAKLDKRAVAEIRAKVRAAHEPEAEPEE
jgi:hypothetical protein